MSKKKKNVKRAKEFPAALPTTTQPHIESYMFGFLQSRGFDLYPRVRETKEGWQIALYFDRGEKGWWRVFQLELGGKESPAHFQLSVAVVAHLYNSGVAPRSPAPMGEVGSKMLRNMILGQLQDGVSPETAVGLLNNIASTLTNHLRPRDMSFNFGDEEEVDVDPGTADDSDLEMEADGDDDVDPVLEEELARLEETLDGEEDEDPASLGGVEVPLEIDDKLAAEVADALVDGDDDDLDTTAPDHLPGYTCTCGVRKVGATGDVHHCDACGLDHERIDGKWETIGGSGEGPSRSEN